MRTIAGGERRNVRTKLCRRRQYHWRIRRWGGGAVGRPKEIRCERPNAIIGVLLLLYMAWRTAGETRQHARVAVIYVGSIRKRRLLLPCRGGARPPTVGSAGRPGGSRRRNPWIACLNLTPLGETRLSRRRGGVIDVRRELLLPTALDAYIKYIFIYVCVST